MRRSLLMLVVVLAVTGCGVVGSVIGWTTFESGGLEDVYRRTIFGAVVGLSVGLVLAIGIRAISRGARCPLRSRVHT
jgi:hypothetical protein